MEALAGPLDWLLGLIGWSRSPETCFDCGRGIPLGCFEERMGEDGRMRCRGCHLAYNLDLYFPIRPARGAPRPLPPPDPECAEVMVR